MRFLVRVFYDSRLDKADILAKNLGVGLPGIVAKALSGEKAAKATHSDVTVVFQPFGEHDRHSYDLEIFIHTPRHSQLDGLNGNDRAREIAEGLKQGLDPLMHVEGFVQLHIGYIGSALIRWQDS